MHAVAMSDEYSQPTLELSRTFEGWWLPNVRCAATTLSLLFQARSALL